MLLDTINNDIRAFLKSKESSAVTLLRQVKNLADPIIKKNGVVTDSEVITVIKKVKKQIAETKDFAARAARNDIVDDCDRDSKILDNYLPKQLTEAEIENLVANIVDFLTESGQNVNKGTVMKEAKSRAGDTLDGKTLSSVVDNKLKG